MRSQSEQAELSRRLSELLKPTTELDEGLLVSATYDGDKGIAVLKFYDPKRDRVWLWYDNTGHKPYCYSKLALDQLGEIRARKDIQSIENEEKLDLLTDSSIEVRKIIATNPLAIGGSSGQSVRDEIKAWEADIKYYENYVYDRGLLMGTYYKIDKGVLSPIEKDVPELVARSLSAILSKNSGESTEFIRRWAELLGQPLCSFKRIATDIEVANEEDRLPDVEKADREIIAVSFHNDAESIAYLYAKNSNESSLASTPQYKSVVFPEESAMLRAVFNKMLDYPVLITFNGDDFDLRYLKHRAENLGIKEDEIPIQLQRQEASLKHGLHIDLYRVFNNRSIQVYVYGNRYSEHTLNGISEALLEKSKIEFEGNIADLPLLELANYCLNDSQLTYELTSASSSLLMKILLVISRIAKMPMNDVARLGVSNWIRSMLFYEHRRMGALIPRTDELAEKGGASSEAIIKGKKYKGGLVIEPKPGVHFGVSVLDFASLYPSIIKVHNLSYETVRCPHEECRLNLVPDTTHWVCTKRKGITSLVVGSLRDLRVSHYKQLAKDAKLSKEERELYSVASQGLKVILNACFTGDTEVVTPDGIKNIRDMKVGDPVVNVNPETLRVEIDRVVEVQRFPHRGDMYHFNDRRFVDLKVTPNHRFLVKDNRVGSKTGTIFRTADEIFNSTNMVIPKLRDGIEGLSAPVRISLLTAAKKMGAFANIYPGEGRRLSSWFTKLPQPLRSKIRESAFVNKNRSKLVEVLRSHYRIPASELTEEDVDEVERAGGFVLLGEKRASKIPARYDSADFASLCGWFVSEGNPVATEPKFYPNGGHRGASSGMVMTQSFGKGNLMGLTYRAEVRRLLDGLGLRHITDSGDRKYFRISNSVLHRWMFENCYVEGASEHYASSKRIPDFVFGSRKNLESFLESCYKGDGSRRDKRYSTSSIRLAKDMVVLLSLLGAKSKIKYEPKDRVYSVIFKNVSAKLTSAGKRWHKYVKKFPYEGEVYCVTTERNHTVIAGRNGRFVPVGQSYGVMGFETFALYCLPVAEATAAYGRYAITKTIDKCHELGINVIYSDTDSLFIENPDKDNVGKVARWAEDELGVELDIDKVYRYVAFSERKKNYFGVLEDGTADIKGLTGKKSVDGNTPILGRIDGKAVFTKVADTYKKFMEGFRIELLSISDDLTTSWREVSDASRHSVRDAYRIATSKGRELKLSGDHSVYLIDDRGNLFCKETSRIENGDVLVGARLIPESTPENILDVCDHIPERVIEMNGLLYSSKKHATTDIPLRRLIPITADLGMVLGVFTAEGNISKNPASRQSAISQSMRINPEVCNELVRVWEKVFGWKIKIHARKPKENLRYYVPVLHAALLECLCGGESCKKHVPGFIFNSDKQVIRSYLRGIFSGDGYSNATRINIASMSRELIIQIGYLVSYFDIDYRIRRAYMPEFDDYYYQLSVIGSSSRKRFATEIGFLQARFHKEPRMEPRNKELLPLTTEGLVSVKKRIAARIGISRFRHINVHDIRHYNMMLLGRYNSVIAALSAHATPAELLDLAKISKMINSQDVTYDEVISVRRIKGNCTMYDFSLPEHERFVAGNLPTLLHNSQTPEFLKKTFYEALDILGKVYGPSDFERARTNIKALLAGAVSKLRNKEIPIDQLAFNVMMGKSISGFSGTTPQHVKAAKLLQNRGKEIKAGDIISYVKTKTPPNVKPASLAKPEEIDVDKYLEYAQSMFDQMLDALGFSFDEIMGSTTLDLFWS